MDYKNLKPVVVRAEGEPFDDYISRKIKAEEKFRHIQLMGGERELLVLREKVDKWKNLCEDTEALFTSVLYQIEEIASSKGKVEKKSLKELIDQIKKSAGGRER